MGSTTVLRVIIVACLIGSYTQWVMASEGEKNAQYKAQWIQLAGESLSPSERVYTSCMKEGLGYLECAKRIRPLIKMEHEREQREFEQLEKKWDKTRQLYRDKEEREREFERQKAIERQKQQREEQMRMLKLAIEAKKLQQQQIQQQREQIQQQREEELKQQQFLQELIHQRRMEQLEAESLRIEQQKLNELGRSRDTKCVTVGNITKCRSY